MTTNSGHPKADDSPFGCPEARRLVVVGASLAGLRAVEAARRSGYQGRITLIGDEMHLPYDRPPLSKSFLAGGDPTALATEQRLLHDLRVDLRLGKRAIGLRPGEGVVVGGEVVPYDRLLIATGSAPRDVGEWAAHPAVHSLRTLDDAHHVRTVLDRVGRGGRVVVVGGGFIGSEVACVALDAGASVTVLEGASVPLVRAVGGVVGAALAGLHGRHGVELRCGVRVIGVRSDDRATQVLLADGDFVPADLVVVGVGAVPATQWLVGSGVDLDPIDSAVVCDEYLRTSLPGVYAAGDVANWPNPVFGARMRLENWTNAAEQGARAVLNALRPASRQAYGTVPYFWSDWYGHRIQFVGTADADSVAFVSGGPDEDRFVALFERAGHLVGAATLNEPGKIMKLRRMVATEDGWDAAVSLCARSSREPVT
ncbi:NAD(P)/FAD-dependent oxidoreductase [Embleya scabrispora]|uniref:NAD(P)/FAD-dependent oxidoreductase n=1 Tax=Embleya scabrispora TaxID=159449 RepID=UPI000369FC94|nr:FAD-dependent oxidoreductase [Embleya scabrispora]MYS79222.1 FAD-dependent oxidoreductase [Streptomyces sp. SID5474]